MKENNLDCAMKFYTMSTNKYEIVEWVFVLILSKRFFPYL